ncbi:MAG: alpha/beta hydrolase [Solobacterium sp.]|nr:alpha/beta hydrolase [Solobacterium sp.]
MKQIRFVSGDAEVRGILQDEYDTLKAHRTRPALVICPGGAYRWRSPREKDPAALEFLNMGFHVFILEYSCGEDAADMRPLKELAGTVRQIRSGSTEWHIDPDRIAVLGFSAGGHLAASLGVYWNDPVICGGPEIRPDALILCYPVISTKEYAHEESAMWVSGNDPLMRQRMHQPDHVTESFPPTFMWHGGEDTSVPPENSLMLAVQLRKQHVPVEYHLFATGVHGISMCTQEVETPDHVCRQWVPLCRTWITRLFSYVP